MKEKFELHDRIENYANNDDLNEKSFGGHLNKRFVRVDDNSSKFEEKMTEYEEAEAGAYIETTPKSFQSKKTIRDSVFFKDLFKDLKSGNSHYITYLNDIVSKKYAYLPKYVSCLIKTLNETYNIIAYNECVGCQLSNCLGLDTVYNTAFGNFYDDNGNLIKYDYLISVDAVAPGQTLETFEDLGIYFNGDMPLHEIMESIESQLPDIMKNRNNNLTDEQINKKVETFKRKFIRQYLFRISLCDDVDYCYRNTSVIIDEDGNIQLGPNMDMEKMFYELKESSKISEIEATFAYVLTAYPDVLDYFMGKLQEVHKSGQIENIMNNGLKVSNETKERAIHNVSRNIDLLQKTFERFLTYDKEYLNRLLEIYSM